MAGFGTSYLSLSSHPAATNASHALAVTSLALGGTALAATIAAYLTTHVPNDLETDTTDTTG